MDGAIALSTAKSGQTKDDFIHQAHEARQARELARRRDEAATTIQAFFKAIHVRQSHRKDSRKRLEDIMRQPAIPVECDLLLILRNLFFACDRFKDRNTFDSLIQHIITSLNPKENIATDSLDNSDDKLVDKPQRLIGEAILESIELSSDHIVLTETKDNKPLSSSTQTQLYDRDNFARIVVANSSKSEQNLQLWLNVMEKILNLCLDYLKDYKTTHFDSQQFDTYLQIINLFTSNVSLNRLTVSGENKANEEVSGKIENRSQIVDKISKELLSRTLFSRKDFFRHITFLIYEKISRFRNDLKSSILSSYTQIVMRLLRKEGSPEAFDEQQLSQSRRADLVEILIDVLCIPGFIHNLERHAIVMIKELNDHSIFKLSIKLLVNDQDFQKLTSSNSVCLLANLVHLAALNEDILAEETKTFVILVTKILESCQKNMQAPSAAISGNPRLDATAISCGRKKCNESMNVSFNPFLGWLAREESMNIDKDMIKSQLSHLWSVKFLKILLNDLFKVNEKTLESRAQTSNQSPKSTVFGNYNHLLINDSSSSPNAPIGIFKRAVERATTTMTKSINSSYSKTTGTSSNSGSAKLMTPEANRISLVCCMLYTSLKTLTTLKQDILTGLCLHDYILTNLWTFISSLGPHHGLRAFLDHLTIYTKTSAPEFHVLTLFCECASHLISILDDSELYEKQQPFRQEDLVAISSFLNNFVFRIISNNLIPHNAQDIDPILQTTHKLLTHLYKRDCRRKFASHDHWLIKDIKISLFLKDFEAGKPVAKTIMTMLPHVIPHKERVLIFRKLVSRDKAQYCSGPLTLIIIHRSRIVEDGYQQLIRLPSHALKGLIRVKFINDYGLDEAGIDQDGVFKEFLEDTIKRVFDPALNLFCSTSEQRLYPSPTSRLHEDYLSLFNFVGKMLGKAIYEGIVVDVPFASFFLSKVLGQPQSPLYSPIDELPSLDPELYKSLTYIKHYEGDVSELDLTFSIDQDFMGKIETHELEAGGRSVPVTRESRVRYIHSVANFRMKTQIEKQTDAFVSGFKSIINIEWLSMFSASEFQRLISGDNTPIDLQDLRRHTKYFGGFHGNHRVVCWLWDILERDFTAEEHKLFLKFVTSCSKPPLLGFANLEPPFSIRCIEVSDDQDSGDTVGSILRGFFAIRRSDPVDRLPTSSTCFNLLKLPNYQRRSTLREKLRYAIRCSPGFELS